MVPLLEWRDSLSHMDGALSDAHTLPGGGLRSPPPMRVNTPPATGGRGAGLKFGDSVFGQEPPSASALHDEAPPAIPDISDLQTVGKAGSRCCVA